MKDMKNDSGIRKTFAKFNIQSIILSVLMTLSLVTVTVMGFLLYHRFKLASDKSAVANTEMTVESTIDRLNSSLLDLRQISDAANYNIVQEYDISSQEFTRQFSMLYETNVDKIQSLALYGYDGMLIESEPVATVKDNVKVADQKWYQDARSEIENIHFSTPHVQNLFDDGTFRYHRVVSLSRSVDINDGSTSGSGVLLVDMKYSVLEDMLERINETSSGIYYYLCSRDGEIIYHPRWTEINRGLFKEKNNKAASYEDGIYEMKTDGQKENIVVGSVAYTGWKLIGVVPERVQETSINKFRYYIITTILILVMMLLQVNQQQTERRKSELDALQSQINPHFLYNTLESITWMIEAQRNKEAVVMISELAKLLRVSLSRGKTIISIGDELQHSRSYMNIQRVRYKERFKVEFLIDEEIKNYCIVKLVIQPLLENAIYYGVGNMDEDDDGQILIRGEKKGEDIYISIEDNGMGMPEDIRSNILTDNSKVPKHGSGVGVINVHSRISLMFGPEYGLEVYSELDEGTKVVIHIPAIPYTKENAEQLEKQTYGQRRMPDEEE